MEMVQQLDFPNLFFCHQFKAAGLAISFVAVSYNNSNCFNLKGSMFRLVIVIYMVIKQTSIQLNYSVFFSNDC